jgi:hypothetical protein
MTTLLTQESGHGPIEQYSGAYRSIEVEHAKIHDGKGFLSNGKATIASAASQTRLFKNPAGNYPHLRMLLVDATSAPIELAFYESPVTTADGTPSVVHNYNRASTNTPNLLLYGSPTVTSNGTLLETILVGGTRNSGGMGIDIPTEWVLKPATNYLLIATNISTGSSDTYAHIFWYE